MPYLNALRVLPVALTSTLSSSDLGFGALDANVRTGACADASVCPV